MCVSAIRDWSGCDLRFRRMRSSLHRRFLGGLDGSLQRYLEASLGLRCAALALPPLQARMQHPCLGGVRPRSRVVVLRYDLKLTLSTLSGGPQRRQGHARSVRRAPAVAGPPRAAGCAQADVADPSGDNRLLPPRGLRLLRPGKCDLRGLRGQSCSRWLEGIQSSAPIEGQADSGIRVGVRSKDQQ